MEYDLGCEDVMAGTVRSDAASGDGGTISVGQRAYDTVVLPPMTETVRDETMKLLERFRAGRRQDHQLRTGTGVGRRPAIRPRSQAGQRRPAGNKLIRRRRSSCSVPMSGRDGFAIERAAGDKGILFHQRRQLADGELLLLVNTSITPRCTRGVITTQCQGRAEMGPVLRVHQCRIHLTREVRQRDCSFEIPPCGSLLAAVGRRIRAKPG